MYKEKNSVNSVNPEKRWVKHLSGTVQGTE